MPEPNEGFVSWEEVDRLVRSGCSTSRAIRCRMRSSTSGPAVVDFMRPELRAGYRSLDVP
jgi:hypothetical protein